jgi:hypothetical protein
METAAFRAITVGRNFTSPAAVSKRIGLPRLPRIGGSYCLVHSSRSRASSRRLPPLIMAITRMQGVSTTRSARAVMANNAAATVVARFTF